jgi:hypothetical protein
MMHVTGLGLLNLAAHCMALLRQQLLKRRHCGARMITLRKRAQIST